MNFDLISETVSYCKKIEEKCDFNFTYATTTNGTLLNKDIQSFLVENRFFMYLSIDGRKEIHDTSRKYKDGKGSYENIINITEGFRGNKNVIGRATVIPTESMVDSYKHLCELGFNQIVVSPVHMEMTSEERKQTSLHQVELINHFYGLIDNGEFDKAKKLRNILIPLYKIHTGAIRDIFCNAGTGKVIVDFKGDVFYCAEVVSKQNFRLGNVFSEVDFSKLYSFADMPSYCKDCWCWCLCSGGCPMLREYNSKEEQLMQFCESQRNYYSALLSVYVQLTQQNKDFLFESFVN
jgi:uncharacterized protein